MLQTSNETPSLVIEFLQPYSQYRVVILANTKYGDGNQESEPLMIWTLQDGNDGTHFSLLLSIYFCNPVL